MEPIAVGLTGVALMVFLLLCGVPVAFSMGAVGYAGLLALSSFPAANALAASIPYDIISDYGFCVLPLFVLMANICFFAKFGQRLFDFMYKSIGHLPGGLASASIASCAVFGAVSASILATNMTIGLVAIPEMKRYKYDPTLGASSVAAGGVLGILIPPSASLIVYGIMTEQSIGELFISGIIPGVLLAIMFMIGIFIRCRLNPTLGPAGPKFSIREKISSLFECIDIFLLIVLSIGGLMAGIFTPTEAGGIGSAGALLFAVIRKRLSWKDFIKACEETIVTSSMIYILLIGALIFNAFLTQSTIPMELAGLVSNLRIPPIFVIFAILLVYIIMGCFIDAMAMLLLTIPAFFPVIVSLGYDPIWFGVIVTMAMGMAAITPPVGMSVYVIAGIDRDVSMQNLFRAVMPFFIIEVIFTVLIVFFPQIVLWLPRKLFH